MTYLLAELDPLFVWSNRAEGAVWAVIAVGVWIRSRPRDARLKRSAGWAAAVLVAFGVSDLVEATTGAWWQPWWLLAWKAGCVVALVWLFARMQRSGARGD